MRRQSILILGGGGGSSSSGVDASIADWTALAAIATTSLSVPQIKVWYDDAAGVVRHSVLKAGTDATDTANGIQRPDDYAPGTNEKVWYTY
jgi:hypothetical protein